MSDKCVFSPAGSIKNQAEDTGWKESASEGGSHKQRQE